MMCYKDKRWCSYHKNCSKGATCPDAFTDEVKARAIKWWGSKDAPVSLWTDKPNCFKGK